MITVGHLAPRGCWDETLIQQLLTNELWPTGLEFRHVDGFPGMNVDGCCLIVPGQYWHERTGEITEALGKYKWVLGFRTGDEEDLFDTTKVEHPNLKWWIQTPRTDRHYGASRLFGVGHTPQFSKPTWERKRILDVFLSAQNTHQRRAECFDTLKRIDCKKVVSETEGFTQGMPPADYTRHMLSAKIAVCPSGAFSPDSFRVWEALQAHCVPIVDQVSPAYYSTGYWHRLFDDPPFPILTNWEQLPGYIEDQLGEWPGNANLIAAWWARQKRRYALDLVDDLTDLGAL